MLPHRIHVLQPGAAAAAAAAAVDTNSRIIGICGQQSSLTLEDEYASNVTFALANRFLRCVKTASVTWLHLRGVVSFSPHFLEKFLIAVYPQLCDTWKAAAKEV